MAITLDTFTLPDGLRWTDEFAWSPTAQQTGYLVAGALLVEESVKQAGRPITLVGGQAWAWMQRAEVEALHAALSAADARFTLSLHDGRQFTVIPRQDGDGPLIARALPVVRDSGPADPVASSQYIIERIRLLEVA